jgi:hypothetical protein
MIKRRKVMIEIHFLPVCKNTDYSGLFVRVDDFRRQKMEDGGRRTEVG